MWTFALGCGGAPADTGAAPPTPPSAASVQQASQRAGGLTWDSTAPLVPRAVRTELRAAEYGVEGEPGAELVVFYFGSAPGGPADATVQRWLAQIEQPDGSDSASKARRATLAVSGLEVTTLEVRGVYTGPLATTAAPAAASESTLLGAIVPGPRGAVYFKLTGPTPGVERARDAFERLLRSLRPE